MNRSTDFLLVAIFSVFLGSQITEGFLFLPYWKALPATDFFEFYAQFGPAIGRFYTILTLLAAAVPVLVCGLCLYKKSPAVRYSLVSVFFTVAFVASFYLYFKGANQQFLDASLDAGQLQAALLTWGNWHWSRVVAEVLALVFLVLTLNTLAAKKAW